MLGLADAIVAIWEDALDEAVTCGRQYVRMKDRGAGSLQSGSPEAGMHDTRAYNRP